MIEYFEDDINLHVKIVRLFVILFYLEKQFIVM